MKTVNGAEPPRQLSVGILLSSPSGGGALSAIGRLIPLLETAGHDVTLLTEQNPLRFRLYSTFRAKVIPLPASRIGSLERVTAAIVGFPLILRAIITIRREARCRPDLVLLPFLTGTALVTLAATLGLRNPILVCERNDPSRQIHGWHVELLKRVLYPRASAITVNASSRAARAHLIRVSRGRPVHFVPNPRPKRIPPADVHSSRVILAVGRLAPQKRHATLIEAFAQVHERIPDWRLRIAGDGPLYESLAELTERFGLEGKIDLMRHVDDVGPLYSEAGLFVLASDYEGTSNALLEAASAGLPCIVSDETAPPAAEGVFTHVPAGSIDGLASALLHLCRNPAHRELLGESARNWVAGTTDGDVVTAWQSVLQSLSSE